jgi:LysM repeat protein
VVIPVALTTLLSVFMGAHGAHAAEPPRSERPAKTKAVTTDSPSSAARGQSLALRAGKYTVELDDTVSNIARRAGISTAELLAANGLSWKTLIFAGQQLDIPTSTSGYGVISMTPTIKRHRVESGDTLEAIGRSFGVQPRALMTANGLDRSSRLIVGQRLVIPDASLMGELPAQSIA